jgi:pseudouridine synthase
MPQERLQKFLSRAGISSRREAEKLIQSGNIGVNGKIIRELGFKIDPSQDQVFFNRKLVSLPQQYLYLAFNKPSGFTVTKKDRFASKTVYDLLPSQFHHLKPIGRLDVKSEGLLIFTDDGELINILTHPKFAHTKEYLITVKGKISPENIQKIEKGIILEGKKTLPSEISQIRYNPKSDTTTLNITLKEGRKRQIRKMFIAIQHPVLLLKRVRIEKLELKNLPLKGYKIISKKDIL